MPQNEFETPGLESRNLIVNST